MRAEGRKERGGVAVEFAIIVPLMAWIILGVWHFSHSYLVYSRLQWAVRDGARYAALTAYVEGSEATFVNAVKDVVCCGSQGCNCASQPVVQGLTKAKIDVIVTKPGPLYRPTSILVRINNFSVPLPYSPLSLTNKPQVRYPFVGHFSPFPPE
jgi:hypothetical protein